MIGASLLPEHAIFRDALTLVEAQRRTAEAFRQLFAEATLGACFVKNIFKFNSLISRKSKCQSSNELHLYISEGKTNGFLSVYCNQPFLHSL